MTRALVGVGVAVILALVCWSLLVRASADDHTPTRTYVACIAGGFLACTALSVALLAFLRVAVA